MNNKIIEVQFTFEDGQKRILKGEQFSKWDQMQKQAIEFAKTKGMVFPWNEIRWKNENDEYVN